jgi:hypothetical protein
MILFNGWFWGVCVREAEAGRENKVKKIKKSDSELDRFHVSSM